MRAGCLAFGCCLLVGFSAAQGIDGASWRVSGDGPEEKGINVLDGGDGCFIIGEKLGQHFLTNRPETVPPSTYLYFAVDDALTAELKGPLYVEVEYFDASPGGMLTLQYDSAGGDTQEFLYRECDDQWGGWMTAKNKWRRAVFLLETPSFKNRQNQGADFRLGGAIMYLRKISILVNKPELPKEDAGGLGGLRQRVHIDKGGQLIIGGFDPERASDVKKQIRALKGAIPAMKSLGVTSHEGYVRWNLCEPEPGKYDWSVYDAFVEVYKQNNLKWVPFLIVGSPYSLPDWFYKKEGFQGYVCLEHNEQSDVQSLWNPAMKEHVARFIEAFCERYKYIDVIESILLGITGNYGEAIYVASGNDWTSNIHGQYHTHEGFWAGDPFAQESFKKWLTEKYTDAAKLSEAWKTPIADINAAKPFLRKDAPSDRAWIDFCDWYIGSMTDWARFWMQETRKHFPGDIYLCTGGNATPEHGSNFGEQCKLAAEIKGGVRITNEASDPKMNFALTRWVATAGKQYGAYYSFEPAGEVNSAGVIARIFNASTSGARGLHYYYPNLFANEQSLENFALWGSQFKQRKPRVEVAVYYPQTYIKLNGNKFLEAVAPLRDCFDFDFMSDGQILDGGLTRIKALILVQGNIAEANVWQKITEWVREGGLITYPDGMGRLRSVEGDESVHEALLGPDADAGKGRVLKFSGLGNNAAYRGFLSMHLPETPELSKRSRAMIRADGREDNLFVALVDSRTMIWFNGTGGEVQKGRKIIPPYSIEKQLLPLIPHSK
ncbi:MAG TPA: beta-galactosidase [Candidatus Hydrogenedentes bacterium]|nr:beta-galactosidase [Candidatus Hydrogenedentota bacterium]